MRASLLLAFGVAASFSLSACGGSGGDGPKNPADAKQDPQKDPSAPASSGDAASHPSGGDSHPLVGNPAPDLAGTAANNKAKVGLKELTGKVVVVDFWATWCGPCKESFPKLQGLSVKYQANGLEIVGVSEDDDANGIAPFAQSLGTKFPLVWDDGKKFADKWKPPAMPSTYVLDKKGVVRFVHNGFHPGDEAELEKEIKSLL